MFSKLFLNSLNGNFFKLKHLYSYLHETTLHLNNELKHINKLDLHDTSSQTNHLPDKLDDLNEPFDCSLKSLFILNEINRFLAAPCTLNIFKLAIYKNNNFKKYLLFSNNINCNQSYLNSANKDCDLLNDNRFISNVNANNNDEKFANMNKSNNNKNMQEKSFALK